MVWQVDRAQQLHALRHPSVPANLMCIAGEHNPALARAEGLEEIGFWFEMVRNVHDPDPVLPPVRPVEGIRIEAFERARADLSLLAVVDHHRAAVAGYLLAYVYPAGHQDVYLGVDADNATGALSLYERAGFRIDQRLISWGRTIPACT